MSGQQDSWVEIEARLAQLVAATAFVETFCRQHAIAPADTLRLVLVVEELVTNVITHGYGGDRAAPVRIGLQAEDRDVTLQFEDTAPAFDPHSRLAQGLAELEAGAADRPVGHLGLPLVFRMASASHYEHAGGWNRLRLVLPRSS
jgi:anti-sigma regulatory factor (Ser/Thr protein kinase)